MRPVISSLRYFLPILLLGFFSSVFFGCQKDDINGDLDGQWEVMEVTPHPHISFAHDRAFYNFQLHVCKLSYYGDYFTNGNLSYDMKAHELTIQFPYVNQDNFYLLQQFGILSNPVKFNVDFIDSHHLILSNDQSSVYLLKH